MIGSEDIRYLGRGIKNLLSAYPSREEFISGLDELLVLGFMEQTDCISIISAPTSPRKPHKYSAAYLRAYSGKLYKKDNIWTFKELSSFVKSYQTCSQGKIVCESYQMINAVMTKFAPPGTNLSDLLTSHTPREIRYAFTLHGLADGRLRLASPLIKLPYEQYELLRELWGEESK